MKRNRMWFMAEDDGGGGGGEPDLTPSGEGAANESPEGFSETKPETPVEEKAPAFDSKALADALGESMAKHFPKPEPAPAPKKELTPAERKALLNEWEPDDNWYKDFDNLETRNKAVLSMRDGYMRQADTVAQLRIQAAVEQMQKQYEPIMRAVQQQQVAEQQSRFDKTYPQLAEPRMKQILSSVSQSIVSEKMQFKNEGDMFKEVARRAEAVAQQFLPDFKLSAGASASQSKSGRSIPVTTTGGGGGSGKSGSGDDGRKSKAIDLLPGPP